MATFLSAVTLRIDTYNPHYGFRVTQFTVDYKNLNRLEIRIVLPPTRHNSPTSLFRTERDRLYKLLRALAYDVGGIKTVVVHHERVYKGQNGELYPSLSKLLEASMMLANTEGNDPKVQKKKIWKAKNEIWKAIENELVRCTG